MDWRKIMIIRLAKPIVIFHISEINKSEKYE